MLRNVEKKDWLSLHRLSELAYMHWWDWVYTEKENTLGLLFQEIGNMCLIWINAKTNKYEFFTQIFNSG